MNLILKICENLRPNCYGPYAGVLHYFQGMMSPDMYFIHFLRGHSSFYRSDICPVVHSVTPARVRI